MSIKEAMTTLLGGKTLYYPESSTFVRIQDDRLVMREALDEEWSDRMEEFDLELNDPFSVFSEKDILVPFAQAVGMMAQGKVMMSIDSKVRFRIQNEAFQYNLGSGDWGAVTVLDREEMEQPWCEVI